MPSNIDNFFGQSFLSQLQFDGDISFVLISMCALNKQPSCSTVSAFGQAPSFRFTATGAFSRYEANISHKFSWMVEATQVAEFGNGAESNKESHPPQSLNGFDNRVVALWSECSKV